MKCQFCQVCVVGAGISGLAAARQLANHKNSCIILEAQEKIGGRIQKVNLGGVQIDTGAYQLAYFCENNPLVALITKKKWPIKIINQNKKIAYYNEDGSIYEEETVSTLSQKLQKIFQNSRQNFETNKNLQATNKSLYEVSKEQLEEFKGILSNKQQHLLELLINMIQQEEAGSIKKLSSLTSSLLFHEKEQRDLYPLPANTFHQIVENLYKGTDGQQCLKVYFNSKVISIYYANENSEFPNKVVYQCLTSHEIKEIRCKEIICSVPLSQLKSKKISFHPELPNSHAQAIQNLQFGLMNKIILRFSQRFWPQDVFRMKFASSQKGKFPHFVDLSDKGCHILSGFVTQQFARSLSNNDQQVITQVNNFLEGIFKCKITILDYRIVRWEQVPFIEGSYAYMSPASSYIDTLILRKPINESLWMVGEYCYGENIGTAHGAFQTGQNAAKAILERAK